jgi:hypothetical protein
MADKNASIASGDHNSFEEVMKDVSVNDCLSFDDIIFQPPDSTIAVVTYVFKNPRAGKAEFRFPGLPAGRVFE